MTLKRVIAFSHFSILFYFLRFYLFIFREREREGEREGEKHQCTVASHTPLTGDLACNPGMCPDWESNQRPFGSQAGTQSIKPHQPGSNTFFKKVMTLSSLGRQNAKHNASHLWKDSMKL